MEWDVYSTWKLQLQIRFNLFWKLWLYLCSRKWLRPTRSLVVSLKFNSSMVFTVKNAHCLKGVRIWSYSGPHFSCIFPLSNWIQRDTLSVFSSNAGKCRKNTDQNNSEYGHFLRSVYFQRSHFFTLPSNYFDEAVTWEQLFLQTSYFCKGLLFQNSHFFAAVIFSKELLSQSEISTASLLGNRKFFGGRCFSGQLAFWWSNCLEYVIDCFTSLPFHSYTSVYQ